MNNILDINERILYLIENQYNNNQKRFAESIGYSAQVVFNIVSGRKTKPSFDVINAIISTNDNICVDWLITGKGSMLKSEAKGGLSQNITGDSNIQSGKSTNVANDTSAVLECKKKVQRLENELKECKIKLDAKENQVSQLINTVTALSQNQPIK